MQKKEYNEKYLHCFHISLCTSPPEPSVLEVSSKRNGFYPGFIYVIGGISDEGMELRSAEVYDPISRRWSALPVMATRRAYVGVACLNNCIYAVGGWNEALGALETVEKYCPEEVKSQNNLFTNFNRCSNVLLTSANVCP